MEIENESKLVNVEAVNFTVVGDLCSVCSTHDIMIRKRRVGRFKEASPEELQPGH
jgi:hypothetical protein